MNDRRAIRYGLLTMHWGWLGIISLPDDIIANYRSYETFHHTASTPHWMLASFTIALIATVGTFKVPFIYRDISAAIQAMWLLLLSALFSLNWPPMTGSVAYLVLSGLACWLVFAPRNGG